MNNRCTAIFLLVLLMAASLGTAQEFYLDKFEQVADLKVFQSLDEENKWYYLADQIQIAQRNGKPQFSFLKFVTNQDTGSEGGITGAQGGGVVHLLVEFRVSDDQKRRAEQELQRKHPGATIAGPIIYRSGTFALISATLDEDGEYADKIVGVGRAPVMEGHKAAISILLSRQGATLLWESFKTDTPDISINYEMEIAGYREPFEAKVTGDWNLISKHSNLALGLRASMIGLDVQRTVSELRQSNAIEVEVKGEDEMGDAMVTQIEGKLVDFIFEKINDPRVLQSMVEDRNLYSNVERANRIYDQNQRSRSGNSSSSSSRRRQPSGSSASMQQPSLHLQGSLQLPRLSATAALPGFQLYRASSLPRPLRLPAVILKTAEGVSLHPSSAFYPGGDDIEEWGRTLRAVLTDLFAEQSDEAVLRRESRGMIIRAIERAVDPFDATHRYSPTQRFNSLHSITFRDFSEAQARIEHLLEIYFVEARAFQERVQSSGDGEPRLILGEAEEIEREEEEGEERIVFGEAEPIDTEEEEPGQRIILGEAEPIETEDSDCGTSYGRRERISFNSSVRSIVTGGGGRAAKINRIIVLMQRELQQHTGSRANVTRLRENLNIIFDNQCFPEDQQKISRIIRMMFDYINALCNERAAPVVHCGDTLSGGEGSGEVMDFSEDAPASEAEGEVMDFSDTPPADETSGREQADRDRQISKSGASGSKSGGTPVRSSAASGVESQAGDEQEEQEEEQPNPPQASGGVIPTEADSEEGPTAEQRAALLRSGGSDSAAQPDQPERSDQASRPAQLRSGRSERPARRDSSAGRSRGGRARPGTRVYDQRQARERGSSFALMAAYRIKRYKTSGSFSFSFNKKMLQSQIVTMAHNVGDLYNRYGSDPAVFKEVNLDDPVYKQREIIVFLDGQDKEAFDKYINYVTVSLRKRHQNGQITQDEIRIDRNTFNQEGNVFRMLYGWKGDADRSKWLEYEYKTTWSYHGGFSHDSDWQRTSDFNITVTPPHRYRTIQLEGDPEILRDEGVRLTTITFYYTALGREMPPIQVSMRTNSDDLAKVLDYFHTAGIFDYEYELKWRVRGQYVTSGRLKGDEDFIFIDELPGQF